MKTQNLLSRSLFAGACFAGGLFAAHTASAQQIGDVFVISMENHNWTQPNGNVNNASSTIEQIKGNGAAPFINSLINGTASATINGTTTNISQQTAYTDSYYNVMANAGSTVSIHPSEPNYIWSEAGTNFGVLNDNQPYGTNGTNQNTNAHLTSLMNTAGVSWKSYQEGVDLVPTSGGINNPGSNSLTNTVADQSQWTSPIVNFSGTSASYTNQYNGSHQYNYAVKHNPMEFFTDTNGGNNLTTSNPARLNYAPLEQLQTDLNNNAASRYNWITPDQYNDMHTQLSGGFTYGGTHYTGDAAQIAQGDNFLSIIVPQIMSSQAYQNNGAIVIWMDESEPQNGSDTLSNDFNHTLMEIVISPLAHPNVNGLPFDSAVSYTHSSDLKTWQELFGLDATSVAGQQFLGDANSAGTNDLSGLFQAGAVSPVPEVSTTSVGVCALLLGVCVLRARQRCQTA
jgi:hypothetical protein